MLVSQGTLCPTSPEGSPRRVTGCWDRGARDKPRGIPSRGLKAQFPVCRPACEAGGALRAEGTGLGGREVSTAQQAG